MLQGTAKIHCLFLQTLELSYCFTLIENNFRVLRKQGLNSEFVCLFVFVNMCHMGFQEHFFSLKTSVLGTNFCQN